MLLLHSMVNDEGRFTDFIRPGYEKKINISFNPSTNREVLNECQSHMNSNPPSKVSVSYQLVFTIVDDNLTVSEAVDLIDFRQQTQDDERYDIFLYLRGVPARLFLDANNDLDARLYLITKSNIPGFDDDRIPELISSWGLE